MEIKWSNIFSRHVLKNVQFTSISRYTQLLKLSVLNQFDSIIPVKPYVHGNCETCNYSSTTFSIVKQEAIQIICTRQKSLRKFVRVRELLLLIQNLFNPLSSNFIKWSNTLKQFVGKLPWNCLSLFDHFVGLALKGLKYKKKKQSLSNTSDGIS